MALSIAEIGLAINIGMLAAVVYVLRMVVTVDKKVTKLMRHEGIREDDF